MRFNQKIKGKYSASLILLVLGFSFVFGGCSQKARQENVLAHFDGQIVTLEELEKEISELPEWKQKNYSNKAGREEYLTLMAESRMILEVAIEKGLDKNPEIVKQTREYRDQLMVKELVKREVDDKVKITDADLSKYYADHKSEYVEPEKVSVTEITLDDEEKAKEVMNKIKDGADFTELAKEMADKSESLGPGQRNAGKVTFSRNSYASAQIFTDTAFGLEVGQISDMIVQPIGENTYYMIVRMDEHIPERQQELAEVEAKVRRAVEKETKKEIMDKWLETLKVEKKFQLYPEKLPETPVAEEEKVEGGEEKAEVEETEGAVEEKSTEPAEDESDTETKESQPDSSEE